MRKKLTLDLEALAVDSSDTSRADGEKGPSVGTTRR